MPRKKQKVDKSVLEHRKEAKRLLEHSKIKPLPKWSGPASILNISNMTPKQHHQPTSTSLNHQRAEKLLIYSVAVWLQGQQVASKAGSCAVQ